MPTTDTLIPATNFTDSQTVPVTINGKNILICKANGDFYAVDNICTHQRAELTGGRIRNCFLACPLHGVRFDLRTGKPMGELTRVPLKTYDVRLADNGNLQIELD
jgi:3-phenylpropionate/trans-cinnamate dioxygenase ferredoxin component